MTIDYDKHKKIIIEEEAKTKKPFVGFISPSGDLLDFNTKNSDNIHDDWHNIVAYSFLKFVSFMVKDQDGNDVLYRGLDNVYESNEQLLEGLNKFLSFDTHGDNMLEFRKSILICLKNAYSGKSFFDSMGRDFYIDEFSIVNSSKKDFYREKLMEHFKDIAVMYLGYDALERFDSKGKKIQVSSTIQDLEENYDEIPRLITTSNFKVGERFFNYMLMDWKIYRVPRLFFNEGTRKYQEESKLHSFYQQEQIDEYEKEIEAIKKYVPLKERHKYFI